MITTNDIEAGAAAFFNSSFEKIFELPEICAFSFAYGWSGTFVLSGENVNDGVNGFDGVNGLDGVAITSWNCADSEKTFDCVKVVEYFCGINEGENGEDSENTDDLVKTDDFVKTGDAEK